MFAEGQLLHGRHPLQTVPLLELSLTIELLPLLVEV